MLLETHKLSVRYGGALALQDVSVQLSEGEAICVIGPNGAGKTTLLRAISGLVPAASGSISIAGQPVQGEAPRHIARRGVAHVPEGRRILATLSVLDNLLLGAYLRDDAAQVGIDLEKVFDYFPVLRKRTRQ